MTSTHSRNGAVTVRQFDPGSGWTLSEARELLNQGYSIDHVQQRTGWPRPMLTAGRPARRASSRR